MLHCFLDSFQADILAFFTSLFIMLLCGNRFITFMHAWQHEGQPIRECGPQSHLITKKGTPTMGGVLILLSIIISTLLYADLSAGITWVLLSVIVVFGATGFYDDYIKVKKHTPDAMTAKVKLLIQFSVALVVALFSVSQYPDDPLRFSVLIPSVDFLQINLWYLYIPFIMIVIAGTSNAVNLSDGLDGLAAGLLIPPFLIIGVIAFALGTTYYVVQPGMSVIASATVGGCLGFLWFNCSPAKIFMGDTGSLALGALLGSMAVLIKQEILLALIGFVFVVETLSVMIQVFWYKRTKKRVFLMAPIHHHFEQLGWKETTVVMRFWIVGWIFAILGAIWLFAPLWGEF